jgi:hypothetical protein
MGLIPLTSTKNYWSSERKIQIIFLWSHNVQKSLFTDILDDACREMITIDKAIGPSKGQESMWGD